MISVLYTTFSVSYDSGKSQHYSLITQPQGVNSDSAYKIICNKNNQIVCDQKNIFPANFPFFYRNI